MATEVREGLSRPIKQIPSKYFYDRRGSRLFERITELPEYYLTRAETALLESRGREIARITRPVELLEPGAGAATKTRFLIEAGRAEGTLRRFVPVEVSQAIAERSAQELASRYPGLEVHAVVDDFEHPQGEIPRTGRRVVALFGSTIGNYRDLEAVTFLKGLTNWMEDGDWLLLGTDLVKETELLEAAYNDAEGVTAEFNRNILNVINRYLGGNFDPESFEHVAFYNAEESRIESYLRATRDESVRLEAIDFEVRLDEGELVWTEVSCKYTRESVERMLADAGLRLEHWFEGEGEQFALSLSRLSG